MTAFFAVQFHVNLTDMMETLADNAGGLSNSEIVMLLEWAETYTGNVASLFEGAERLMQPPVSETLRPLVSVYCSRSREMMSMWSSNIMRREMRSPPTTIGTKYYSPGGVDLFQIVGSQISAVLRDEDMVGTIKASLLGALMEESGAVLKSFAESQAEYAREVSAERGGGALERLCALANNQLRSYKETVELAEQTSELMYTYLDLDEAAAAFLESATAAVSGIADVVFVDISGELQRLFASSAVEEVEEAAATIVATFEDYYGDLRLWLEKSMWKELAVQALDQFAVRFVCALLCARPSMSPEILIGALPEVVDDVLGALRVEGVDAQKTEAGTRAIDSMLALARAPPGELAREYEDVLVVEGPVELKVIESLLDGPRREEFEGGERKETVAECEEVLASYVGERRARGEEVEMPEGSVWGRVHRSVQRAKGWTKLRGRKTTIASASALLTPKRTPRREPKD